MLFNSYEFLFLFLPVTLALFYTAVRISGIWSAVILFGASVVFYGYWNPRDIYILLGSIAINLLFGVWISRSFQASVHFRKIILALGIAIDLGILAHYKYSAFFVQVAADISGNHWHLASASLPLGISFFTFTQIAFLVELHRGEIRLFHPHYFALFVAYFPHLIAGPIIHYKNVVPQFMAWSSRRIDPRDISAGLMIFSIGLAKKVMLADNAAPFASLMFDATAHGGVPTLAEAWGGALCFTLQLYFDFSGYSDMAIGLSKMLGVDLPINFDSPYKAENIIEFWRRWHMTLSAFLRDFLYIPLGGSRRGPFRRYTNLMITMLLGGLWHGAAWTFVIWGGLHGLFLIINHAWQKMWWALGGRALGGMATGGKPDRGSLLGRTAGRLLTFLCVVAAWVLFRSADISTARTILLGMVGWNGSILPDGLTSAAYFIGAPTAPLPLLGYDEGWWIAALLAVAWLLPNTNQLVPVADARPLPRLLGFLAWRPGLIYGIAAGLFIGASVARFSRAQFLYFNF